MLVGDALAVGVDAIFDLYGRYGIYRRAGGTEHPVLVIKGEPQRSDGAGFAPPVFEPHLAEIKVCDLEADPAAGDELALDGTVYGVRVPAERTEDGLVWLVRLAEPT